ncbi:MAG: 4Fe-4S binding protein [Chloroflexi bacterium]|nr:4Fe-4S binding protein [Chloroflexota bacterium]
MHRDVYEQLADALDQLPNGFPRTASRVELRILQKICSPEEAWLAGQLTGNWEPLEAIARRVGLPIAEARKQLMQLVRQELAWFDKREEGAFFRLAPFVIGIYEAQRDRLDHELAHLMEEYMVQGGAAGIMRPQPALQRVVPAQAAVKSEWVLPYDDVRSLLLKAKAFHVSDCICRLQQEHIGRRCDFPIHMCLSFAMHERSPWPGDVSQQEALALLDEAERIGLVHTVSNVAQGVFYVCNCCGCCCSLLRGITEWGIENSVARANYYAVIAPELCANCGTCIDRCQVGAITEEDDVPVIDRARCIGCGLCVTGCPAEAAHLRRKPDAETIHPPADYAAWEQARLTNRAQGHSS